MGRVWKYKEIGGNHRTHEENEIYHAHLDLKLFESLAQCLRQGKKGKEVESNSGARLTRREGKGEKGKVVSTT